MSLNVRSAFERGEKPAGRRKALAAWCLYDWSATPFHSVINTFVFSIYFARSVYGDATAGSAAWAYATAGAGLGIAILSPLCGSVADRTGRRKIWIAGLTLVNVAAVAALWFVRPEQACVPLALWLMVAATVGGELSLVFYNAMLADIAPPGRIGWYSGLGWGIGYLGGLAALGLTLVALVQPDVPWFGISTTKAANIRATGPFVALWALAFAWPLLLYFPETAKPHAGVRVILSESLSQLRGTLRRLPQQRNLAWFLLASALYRDGLTTLFAVGGLYAAGTFGMSLTEVLQFAIAINVAAVFGCLAFGRLDDSIGPKRAIAISLSCLLATGAALVLISDKALFLPLAVVLGFFIGPAQSSGRSLMTRLAAPEERNEMFGLYQLAGRSVAFLGPLAFGAMTSLAHSQRAGMASVLGFIALGLIMLLKVQTPKN